MSNIINAIEFKMARTSPMTHDERKRLDRIERRRVSAQSALAGSTTPEGKAAAYRAMIEAGREAVALQGRVDERRGAEWAAVALEEAEAVAKAHGDEPEVTLAGIRRRKPPLERLAHAKLITDEQHAAGLRYRDTWQRLYGGAKGDGPSRELDPLESRIADLRKLDAARGYRVSHQDGRTLIPEGLHGDARLISLCDKICGEEMSLREAIGTSAHKRKVGMERLRKALGLLALHYGIQKTHADGLRAA